MPANSFQIRVCQNPTCGLRYPLVEGQPGGGRCPICLGPTALIIERTLERESVGKMNLPVPSVNLHILLDNIRSAWNAGSIFRAADAFGFRHAYLCGITPTPASAEVQKTALGAEEMVKWSYHRNSVELVKGLHQQNYAILALEQTKASVSMEIALSAVRAKPVIVLVVGNEVTGIDPGILDISDCTCDIPMRGQKRSLNVAMAFAVAAQILITQC